MSTQSPLLPQPQPPSSILIIGAGAFGVSTAHALLRLPIFASTHITIIDAQLPASEIQGTPIDLTLPASYDSSRLIRPDYASAPYARLVTRAQHHWRSNPIFSPFYHESGVVLAADEDLFSQTSDETSAVASCLAVIETAPSAAVSPSKGAEYVRSALDNVQMLHATNGSTKAATKGLPDIQVLPNSAAILAAMGTAEGCTGVSGYLNRRAGWADATGALISLQQRVKELGEKSGRVTWIRGTAERLIFDTSKSISSNGSKLGAHRVIGAHIRRSKSPNLEALYADYTILALGAYTARLLPRTLGPHLAASAQTLAYVRLDQSEAEKLSSIPVLLNLSSGYFVVPPTPEGSDQTPSLSTPRITVLKVARHAHGWRRSELVPDTEPPDSSSDETPLEISISIPTISQQAHLPPPADAPLRAFLAATVPALAHRAWTHERVCWYSETATGDFFVDSVPGYEGVWCCTGGSGHAFKFLPVLGGLVVALLTKALGLEEGGEREAEAEEGDTRKMDMDMGTKGGKNRMKLEANVKIEMETQIETQMGIQMKSEMDTKTSMAELETKNVMEQDAVVARANEMEEMALLWRWRNEIGEARGDGSRGGETGLRWDDKW